MITPIPGGTIHDYVPFYFGERLPTYGLSCCYTETKWLWYNHVPAHLIYHNQNR